MLNIEEVQARIPVRQPIASILKSRLPTIALELPCLESCLDYASLKEIASGLALTAKNTPRLRPFVLILREDLGMALGSFSGKSCRFWMRSNRNPFLRAH